MRPAVTTIVAIAALLAGCAGSNAPTTEQPAGGGDPGFLPGGPPFGGGDGGPQTAAAPTAADISRARRAWVRLNDNEQADVCDLYDSRNGPSKTRRELMAGKLDLGEADMTRVEVESTMLVIRQNCS